MISYLLIIFIEIQIYSNSPQKIRISNPKKIPEIFNGLGHDGLVCIHLEQKTWLKLTAG